MIWWMLLLACFGPAEPPPGVVQAGAALQAWSRGHEAQLRGDVATARQAYTEALQVRPNDPLLLSWLAALEAGEGELARAVGLLDRALEASPAFGVARYNRAAYKARLGDAEGAAADLELALGAGASSPRRALRDPDFAAVLAHPAFSFLPEAPLTALLEVPAELAFLGSRVQVVATIEGGEPAGLGVTLPAVGPVSLVRVEEEVVAGDDDDPVHTLRWTLLVQGAGEVSVGPLRVIAGELRAEAPAATFPTSAPASHRGPDPATLALWTPSARLGDRLSPSVWQEEGRTWVALGGEERVEVRPRGAPEVTALVDREGVPTQLLVYPGALEQVSLGAGGRVLWPIERASAP